MKKLIAIFILSCILFGFTGCSAVGDFFATLGFDTHDYEGEAVLKVHESDSEIACDLADMVKIMTVNSIDIPEFKGTAEAIKLCRDAVLNRMYSDNFAKYAGNPDLIEQAKDMHGQFDFSVVIPAEDFENTAYKYFGGKEKITNESGKMYYYVEDIDAYITAAQPVDWEATINVHSVEETENTFRLLFSCTLDEVTSDTYFALIIKRPDESLYFKYVIKAKK